MCIRLVFPPNHHDQCKTVVLPSSNEMISLVINIVSSCTAACTALHPDNRNKNKNKLQASFPDTTLSIIMAYVSRIFIRLLRSVSRSYFAIDLLRLVPELRHRELISSWCQTCFLGLNRISLIRAPSICKYIYRAFDFPRT